MTSTFSSQPFLFAHFHGINLLTLKQLMGKITNVTVFFIYLKDVKETTIFFTQIKSNLPESYKIVYKIVVEFVVARLNPEPQGSVLGLFFIYLFLLFTFETMFPTLITFEI